MGGRILAACGANAESELLAMRTMPVCLVQKISPNPGRILHLPYREHIPPTLSEQSHNKANQSTILVAINCSWMAVAPHYLRNMCVAHLQGQSRQTVGPFPGFRQLSAREGTMSPFPFPLPPICHEDGSNFRFQPPGNLDCPVLYLGKAQVAGACIRIRNPVSQ